MSTIGVLQMIFRKGCVVLENKNGAIRGFLKKEGFTLTDNWEPLLKNIKNAP